MGMRRVNGRGADIACDCTDEASEEREGGFDVFAKSVRLREVRLDVDHLRGGVRLCCALWKGGVLVANVESATWMPLLQGLVPGFFTKTGGTLCYERTVNSAMCRRNLTND